jgi:hypothetical protein
LHWARAELTLTRNGRVATFVLLRGGGKDADNEVASPEPQLLLPGHTLRWSALPVNSRYIVPLMPPEPLDSLDPI